MTGSPRKRITYQTLEGLNEEVHTQDTGDVSRVITEEDTTKGSKGTHQICLEGDGGLDASSIDAAPADGANSTGHFDTGSSGWGSGSTYGSYDNEVGNRGGDEGK